MHGIQSNGAIPCVSRAFFEQEYFVFNSLYARDRGLIEAFRVQMGQLKETRY